MTRRKSEIVREIRSSWSDIAARARTVRGGGRLPHAVSLLGSGTKTIKGESLRYLTAVVYMSPATEAFDDGRTLCPWATAGCSGTCLGAHSGRMVMGSCGGNARLWKTTLYMGARGLWYELLHAEIAAFVKKAHRKGYRPAIRIDGSTDTGAGARVARAFPDVPAYDYTKSVDRAVRHAAGGFSPNYHVTFSYSGENWGEAERVLAAGGNVAAVFDTARGESLPASYRGFPVFDADETDLRFLDTARGAIAGLRFKAAKDRAGSIERAGAFVLRVADPLRLAA